MPSTTFAYFSLTVFIFHTAKTGVSLHTFSNQEQSIPKLGNSKSPTDKIFIRFLNKSFVIYMREKKNMSTGLRNGYVEHAYCE